MATDPKREREEAVNHAHRVANEAVKDWANRKRSIASRLEALMQKLPSDSPIADALLATRDSVREGGKHAD